MYVRHSRTLRTISAAVVAAVTSMAVLAVDVPAVAMDKEEKKTKSAPPRPAVTDAPAVTEAATAEAALAAAESGKRRVEVLDQRTETSTTWANADGTLTTEQSAGPIRTLKDGKWVEVDIDLKRQGDGSVKAKAHPDDLELGKPGGTKAESAKDAADAPLSQARDLVSLGTGEQKLSVQWKGGLPTPKLDGPQATYPDAVPGADLIVDATRTGFEQYLQVKERPADPSVPLTLPLKVPGLTAAQQADGSVTFTDKKTGEKTATMPAPVMWDAQVDPKSLERTNTAPIPMTVTQRGDTVELKLTPDERFLSDPATKFPVTIDPATNALSVLFDTFVQGGDTTDQSASTDLKIGWPGDRSGTTKRTARSFMTWDTEPFADALVSKAELKLYNYHSWSAQSRPWEVWASDPADTSSRWTKQPALKQKIATSTQTRSRTSNNAGYVTADITNLAKQWASAKADTTASVKVPAGTLVNGRAYTFRTTFDGTHWANGWSTPVTFTVDTNWKLTPAQQTLSAVNSALEADDVTAASASTGEYATVANTPNGQITVPWDSTSTIASTSADGSLGAELGLPGMARKGQNLNGNIVYNNPNNPVGTVVQPTADGGVRTLVTIHDASAPREYRFDLSLPDGAVAEQVDDGSIIVLEGEGEDAQAIGSFEPPWAVDAKGSLVPTSYRIENGALIQTLAFDQNTQFPVVADPFWFLASGCAANTAYYLIKNKFKKRKITWRGAGVACTEGAITGGIAKVGKYGWKYGKKFTGKSWSAGKRYKKKAWKWYAPGKRRR